MQQPAWSLLERLNGSVADVAKVEPFTTSSGTGQVCRCALNRLRSLQNTNRIELRFRTRLPNGALEVEIV
jgi:hypothetical protein